VGPDLGGVDLAVSGEERFEVQHLERLCSLVLRHVVGEQKCESGAHVVGGHLSGHLGAYLCLGGLDRLLGVAHLLLAETSEFLHVGLRDRRRTCRR
jgi:hypothetical protein